MLKNLYYGSILNTFWNKKYNYCLLKRILYNKYNNNV